MTSMTLRHRELCNDDNEALRCHEQGLGIRSQLAIFFVKQKTAYEMRISDWSADVCSSDLYTCDPTDATSFARHRDCRTEWSLGNCVTGGYLHTISRRPANGFQLGRTTVLRYTRLLAGATDCGVSRSHSIQSILTSARATARTVSRSDARTDWQSVVEGKSGS